MDVRRFCECSAIWNMPVVCIIIGISQHLFMLNFFCILHFTILLQLAPRYNEARVPPHASVIQQCIIVLNFN